MLSKRIMAASKSQFSNYNAEQLAVCASWFVFSSGGLIPDTIPGLVHAWIQATVLSAFSLISVIFFWKCYLFFLSCMADDFLYWFLSDLLSHSPYMLHACSSSPFLFAMFMITPDSIFLFLGLECLQFFLQICIDCGTEE